MRNDFRTPREMFPNLPTFAPSTNAARLNGARVSIDEAVKRIRKGLKDRTGITWSVKRGTGTAYAWLDIKAPKALRRFESDGVTPSDSQYAYPSLATRAALAEALGMAGITHAQGISIKPADHEMFVELAEFGETAIAEAPRDWD